VIQFSILDFGFSIERSEQTRNFCLMLCTMLFALSTPAYAQQPAKVHRVCFLSSRAGIEVREEAFKQGLRELGYDEGKNISLEWRFAKGDASQIPALASELIQAKCDVLVAGGTEATNGLKSATATIPVVFTVASDPVGAGLVASLSRPGSNVTGLSLDAPRVER
jgi:putative ABC transport system substrate-binding protein